MSVLNAMRIGDGWYVVVDSAAKREDGTRCHQQKLFVLPHALGVIAARGEQAHLPPYLALKYLSDDHGSTFDEIADGFASIVQTAYDEMAVTLGDRCETIEAIGQEIVLVGHSQKLGAVRCIVAVRPDGSPTFTVEDKPTGHFSPGHKIDLRGRTVEGPLDYIGALTEQQILHERAKDIDAIIGGHMTVALVMERRVVITNIGWA